MTRSGKLLEKEDLRRTLRTARTELSETGREAAAADLTGQVLRYLGASDRRERVVAAYLSAAPEPGTHRLLASLHGAGYNVVVPICEPRYQLSWSRWLPGIDLVKSVRAPLLEPVGARHTFGELDPFRLVLVPGLAMDDAGNRLGQGGGYYDRFLAKLRTAQPAAPAIGYLYEHEVVPAGTFQSTELDMPLEGAFVPSGLLAAAPGQPIR
ncbi:5-formyltetrahydrofolate cyclo-ligase [Arthrobacter sp. H5]|uniref:5-formyltetrahydrofolate cyclo-ligase n=1 Tax=Arthrobacter sp. H5 TaxID=1267973 RepID=UPI0004B9182E|nr:5-formyltetrahydrofolate cyclo-ligase [Arthrobacter sp. H5]